MDSVALRNAVFFLFAHLILFPQLRFAIFLALPGDTMPSDHSSSPASETSSSSYLHFLSLFLLDLLLSCSLSLLLSGSDALLLMGPPIALLLSCQFFNRGAGRRRPLIKRGGLKLSDLESPSGREHQ